MSTILQTKKSYLLVLIHQEMFAFDVDTTIEVDHEQAITIIPNAPQFVKGVINFRGDILPVIDIREKMYKKTSNEKPVTIVLSINTNNKTSLLGALVDKVIGVVGVTEAELLPAPEMELHYNKNFISAMFKKDTEFVFVLNANTVTGI